MPHRKSLSIQDLILIFKPHAPKKGGQKKPGTKKRKGK